MPRSFVAAFFLLWALLFAHTGAYASRSAGHFPERKSGSAAEWTVAFHHDAEGQATGSLLAYDGAGRLKEDSLWTYTWDGLDRLVSMTRKADTCTLPGETGEVVDFTYDADGRRTRKVRTMQFGGTTNVDVSKVLWAGWLPVFEQRTHTAGGVIKNLPNRWFQWGADLSGTLEGAGGIGGLVAIIEENPNGTVNRTLLPVQDGLGNITAVIDKATGATVARYDFGPYGEPLSEGGEADACPFRWQTKWYDAESQHYYFGYRYYDPTLGRWLSRDPLGEAGGFNLYAYCGNDPVNRHDPLGLIDLKDATDMQSVWGWYKLWRRHKIATLERQFKGAQSQSERFAVKNELAEVLNTSSFTGFIDSATDIANDPRTLAATVDHFGDGLYQISRLEAKIDPLSPNAFLIKMYERNGVSNLKLFERAGVYKNGDEFDVTGALGSALIPLPPIAMEGQAVPKILVKAEEYAPRLVKLLTKQRSLFAAKTIPNPGGRLGDALTRQTAGNVINDLKASGFTDISQEVFFQKGSLGLKNRFADIVGVNPQTGESLIINIGKQTKSGIPIMRERMALDDIIFSPTIQNYPSSRLLFIEKGASGLPSGL